MTERSIIDEVAHMDETLLRQANLTRTDWLAAALDCLLEGGVEAVKITRLADRLGVTRGSFYWHFKDRAEVLTGLLEIWRRTNTAAIINAVADAQSPRDGVLALFACWLDTELYDPKLDMAIRAWAQSDSALLAQVRKADQERLSAITDMFARGGQTRHQAVVSARNIYYMQMGYYALDVGERWAERMSYLPQYYLSYVGEALDAAREAAFVARMEPVRARVEAQES